MSRTPKRGKGPGFQFNAKRPGNKRYTGGQGRYAKTRTHRLERRAASKLVSTEKKLRAAQFQVRAYRSDAVKWQKFEKLLWELRPFLLGGIIRDE